MVKTAPRWFTRTNVVFSIIGAVSLGSTNRARRIHKSLTIRICPSDKTRPIFTKVIIVLRTANSAANLIICPATRTCAITFTTHATVDSADLFSWIAGCDEWAFSSAPLNFSGAAWLPLRAGVCCQIIKCCVLHSKHSPSAQEARHVGSWTLDEVPNDANRRIVKVSGTNILK
jgi:hypothetical protein